MNTNRWTEYIFSNGKVAKNRVVVPPMASQTADSAGFVTAATLEHYQRLSESQAGLVFVEYSFVHQTGKGEGNQLGAHSDHHIPGLKKLAEILHKGGALAGFQIVHAGGKADSKITGQALLGASAIPVPVKAWEPETPVEIPTADIEQYVQWYVAAATRASRAGFDIVELHAAHGYGLNQWLSPITNQRTDRYGGSIENRGRVLTEIVQQIKVQVPDLLISVRIPAQDHIPGGLSLAEMAKVVATLEHAGVDLINVSSGIGGWRRPDGRGGEGYLVEDAAMIKLATSLPVIGVGGIESGMAINEMLALGKIDFAAVGRAILKNPAVWYQTHLAVNCSQAAV